MEEAGEEHEAHQQVVDGQQARHCLGWAQPLLGRLARGWLSAIWLERVEAGVPETSLPRRSLVSEHWAALLHTLANVVLVWAVVFNVLQYLLGELVLVELRRFARHPLVRPTVGLPRFCFLLLVATRVVESLEVTQLLLIEECGCVVGDGVVLVRTGWPITAWNWYRSTSSAPSASWFSGLSLLVGCTIKAVVVEVRAFSTAILLDVERVEALTQVVDVHGH